MSNVYSIAALPPDVKPETYDAALQLLVAISDPAAAKKLLSQLRDAAAAHKAAAAQAEQADVELDRKHAIVEQRFATADAAISQKHAEADKRISDKERAVDERLRQRERDLAGREAAVAKADEKYLKLNADLERRLQLVRSAGAM